MSPHRPRGAALALAALLALGHSAASQEAAPLAPPRLPAAAFPKPDRPVAEIISPTWASERERDAVDEAGQVVRLLDIRPGQSVADIGAGSGYHTVRLAKAVGPEGRVLAVDAVPRYLAELGRRLKREGITNATLGLADGHDPRLPAASVDVALLVHMYHEIAQPFAFLANLAPSLRPGARVGIIDLDRPTWEHGTPAGLLRCELAAVGYREAAFHPLKGNIGYLAVFTAPEEGQVKAPGEVVPCRVPRR